MVFVGDVHGNIKQFLRILEKYPDEKVLQVGDMGVGFRGVRLPKLADNHCFFAGNHDCPSLCAAHPNSVGRFGIWENVFFVSGGFSVDAAYRMPGVTWWADEQLSWEEMEEALDLYVKTKPRIVATHDAPISLYPQLMAAVGSNGPVYENSTAHLLEAMFTAHQPEMWFFGHWHESWSRKINGTQFRCLDELEAFELTEDSSEEKDTHGDDSSRSGSPD